MSRTVHSASWTAYRFNIATNRQPQQNNAMSCNRHSLPTSTSGAKGVFAYGSLVVAYSKSISVHLHRGFTLVEALVVVSIISILAAIGAPAFTEMIRNNRLQAAQGSLQSSLNLARSEAVKRGTDANVTVAAATTAGVWKNGWTVFEDKTTTANNGIAIAADGAEGNRLEVVAALPSDTIQYDQTGTLKYFRYNGQGRLVTTTGAYANRSFWFFESTSKKYCIIISATGRVRTANVASSASCATD
jgi:type IV fimbrial biogenesis protein FimT